MSLLSVNSDFSLSVFELTYVLTCLLTLKPAKIHIIRKKGFNTSERVFTSSSTTSSSSTYCTYNFIPKKQSRNLIFLKFNFSFGWFMHIEILSFYADSEKGRSFYKKS